MGQGWGRADARGAAAAFSTSGCVLQVPPHPSSLGRARGFGSALGTYPSPGCVATGLALCCFYATFNCTLVTIAGTTGPLGHQHRCRSEGRAAGWYPAPNRAQRAPGGTRPLEKIRQCLNNNFKPKITPQKMESQKRFLSQQLSSWGAASKGTPIITPTVYLPYLKI